MWTGIGAAGTFIYGILFYGDPNGDFVAVDERDGKVLWNFPTNEIIKSSPMTYTVNGKQYIAIVAGRGGFHYASYAPLVPELLAPPDRGSSIWVFELP